MRTYINPQHLWKYREFDRSITPAPSCFGIIQYSVEQIAEYLKTHAMEPVSLVVIDDERALLVDGCHRLLASIMNGTKMIPVNVTHITQEEADADLYPATVARFVSMK